MKINPKIKELLNEEPLSELEKHLNYLYGYRGGVYLGYYKLTNSERIALDEQIEYIKRLIKSWALYMGVELVNIY